MTVIFLPQRDWLVTLDVCLLEREQSWTRPKQDLSSFRAFGVAILGALLFSPQFRIEMSAHKPVWPFFLILKKIVIYLIDIIVFGELNYYSLIPHNVSNEWLNSKILGEVYEAWYILIK